MIKSDYPLSPIYSTKNLAKTVSRDQEHKTKANFVGAGSRTVILRKIKINLETFGRWYSKLLDEVKGLQADLFGGIPFDDEEWLSVTVPEILVDDVNLNTPGFCFADNEMNGMKKYEIAGLRVLIHHPRFKGRFGCVPPGRSDFVPNPPALHDFLRRASFVRTKLATLLHISCGGPARGPEFTSQYLRNHPQGELRNVKVIDGELCLVAGYNKTSSIASLASVFPQRP